MVTGLDEFTKEHEYLICVDSDGCAMDTMNCKHLQCFGPCMVAGGMARPLERDQPLQHDPRHQPL